MKNSSAVVKMILVKINMQAAIDMIKLEDPSQIDIKKSDILNNKRFSVYQEGNKNRPWILTILVPG